MSASIPSPYVSVMEHAEAFQLSGNKVRNPLKSGQMIVVHGTFDDLTETGAFIFFVLRDVGSHTYLLLRWVRRTRIGVTIWKSGLR